jgi:hypothetical protein
MLESYKKSSEVTSILATRLLICKAFFLFTELYALSKADETQLPSIVPSAAGFGNRASLTYATQADRLGANFHLRA